MWDFLKVRKKWWLAPIILFYFSAWRINYS
ncbi:MAG: DUF5989 family protein [Ignavibacteriales bacterium]|nr:DUF5989 family protein [Ignavibacteriales bacterium]